MDFASLTSDQKQAIICARAIEQYAHSVLNSACLSEKCSENSALVKLYACFLTVDDTAFHRSDDVRYQCLAQLAGTFDDYKKYSSEIADTYNRYIASWNARRIRFADDPYAKATINNFPSLLCMVAEDLQNDGYSIDALFLNKCAAQYCEDFSANNPSGTSDDQYLSELNQVLDELEAAVPNSVIWKTFRNVLVENFKNYFDQYFSDPSNRPSPQQYAVEYILFMCIDSIDKEPFIDTSHKLTDAGDYLKDFALRLGDYGVKKKYITPDSWKNLSTQLLEKTDSVYPVQSVSKSTVKTVSSKSIIIFSILLFIFAVAFLYELSSDRTNAPSASSRTPVSAYSRTPLEQPQTGLLYSATPDEELAPFDITANSNTNYLIRLCDGKKIIQSYYIRAGETLSVYVPLGSYSLYYACASKDSPWFGKSDLWDSATSYYKSNTIYTFDFDGEYYNGYTLELLGRSSSDDGNTQATESSSNVWDSFY